MAIKIIPSLLAAVILAIVGSSSASDDYTKHSDDDYTVHPHKGAYDYKSIFSLIVNGKCGVIPGRTTMPEMEDEDLMRSLKAMPTENGAIDTEALGGVVGSFGEYIDECQYHDSVAIEGFEILSEAAEANATAPSSVWYCCPGKLLAYFDEIAKGCSHSLAGDTLAYDGYCGNMLSAGLSVVTQYGKMQTICCGPKDNFIET